MGSKEWLFCWAKDMAVLWTCCGAPSAAYIAMLHGSSILVFTRQKPDQLGPLCLTPVTSVFLRRNGSLSGEPVTFACVLKQSHPRQQSCPSTAKSCMCSKLLLFEK